MTRKEQKEERRKAILMTALDLFVNRGYYETKITDIAAAVPMSTGLMFHYFESKEELLLEQHELECVWTIRRALYSQNTADVTEMLVNKLVSTQDNKEFSENIVKMFGKKSEER